MPKIAMAAAVILLAGCAHVKFADGDRVAIEHEVPDVAQLQAQADAACVESGGRAPATLVSNQPVAKVLPAALTRKVAVFRCSGAA